MDGATEFKFPHPKITTITGTPTAATISQLRRELYANAMAVTTTLGGGHHGYLGIIMPPTEYAAVQTTAATALTPFTAPLHPGAHPGQVAGATGPQITEFNRTYDAAIAVHRQYMNVNQALKTQLLEAVDRVYLTLLEDTYLGYAHVTCGAMLAHLTNTYGIITPDQIAENNNKLDAPWNPDDPIEDLWTRIRDCRRFAEDAQEIISEAHAVRSTLAIIEGTGLFSEAIRDWRKRPRNEWTLGNFMADFTTANRERTHTTTAHRAG